MKNLLSAGLLALMTSFGSCAGPTLVPAAPFGVDLRPQMSVKTDSPTFKQSFKTFCLRNPDFCLPVEAERMTISDAQLDTLVRVNRDVNRRIAPMSDQDNYGTKERWTFPKNGAGDCEDYALEKRRLLLKKGFPAGALRIIVGQDDTNVTHAVLGVVTDQGTIVLDNRTDRALPLEKSFMVDPAWMTDPAVFAGWVAL